MKPTKENKINALRELVAGKIDPNTQGSNQNMTVINLDQATINMLLNLVTSTELKLDKILKKPTEFWLTHKEAQKFFGVSAQTLRNWRHAGHLSYHRVDRNIMIKFSDIETFLKNNRHEAFQYKR